VLEQEIGSLAWTIKGHPLTRKDDGGDVFFGPLPERGSPEGREDQSGGRRKKGQEGIQS